MEINTIEQLKTFLKDNWDDISDNVFTEIISKAFKSAFVINRRVHVKDELEYIDAFVEKVRKGERSSTFYGSQLENDFTVNDVFNLEPLGKDVRCIMFYETQENN
jgi:hypothetical protein